MYVPPQFKSQDRSTMERTIRENPFGILICHSEGIPDISHVPFHFEDDALHFHLSRGNPIAGRLNGGTGATAIFTGPHAYISPTWYEYPKANVPTWVYVTVHAHGKPVELAGDEKLTSLSQQVAQFEGQGDECWSAAGLDPGFLASKIKGISVFKMPVERFEPAFKMNQHKSDTDRRLVMERLAASDRPKERQSAAFMRELETGRE